MIKKIIIRLLISLTALAAWLGFVFYSAFNGLWMSPVATPDDVEGFLQQASTALQQGNAGGNSALVLIENGEVAAEYYSTSQLAVNSATVFSTASMSKWIAAAGVMKLIEDGALDLDDSVSNYFTRWQLPEGEFDIDGVTVRRLISHTAGFTDELGFGDYTLDETLPSLEEELANPRASSGEPIEIKLSLEPGSAWRYSGGSYLLLELLIEEVTGLSFESYLQQTFFDPLGMTRSTYNSLNQIENNAGSYTLSGEPAPIYQYASSAATAFATSASDLVRFVRAQIPQAESATVLQQDTIKAMREPHGRTAGFDVWGLGTILYAPTANGDRVFGHDGGNDPAINSVARINPDTGDALIVLETGHPSLATQIGSQWVLWQTGSPDVLDSDSVIASMLWPAVIGSLFLLLILAWIFLGRRERH